VKALRLHGARDLRLHEEPDCEPQAGEAVMRVRAVGLCGSDRHWVTTGGIGDASLDAPLVLGHEAAGVVVTGPRAGQRVALDPAVPCHRCATCQAGLSHLCPSVDFAGHAPTDGALRTLLAWPEALLRPLPDEVDDAHAPLLEPLGVALHALRLGHAAEGTRAGVFGSGPLGVLVCAALRATKSQVVVATDVLPHRRAAAAAAGAARVLAPGEAGESLRLDVAFEVAGDDGALADAIAATRPGGRVVLVGIPDDDRTSFGAAAARRKGLSLMLCRRMRAGDLDAAIDAVAANTVDLAPAVTSRYAFENWSAAFDDLVERRGVKVVIEL
jgi:L-iditol 2-dehydrogenase